jgi:hypothetical protein
LRDHGTIRSAAQIAQANMPEMAAFIITWNENLSERGSEKQLARVAVSSKEKCDERMGN